MVERCAVPQGGQIKSKGNSLTKRKVCGTRRRSDQFIWKFLLTISEKEKEKERKKERKKGRTKERKKENKKESKQERKKSKRKKERKKRRKI